MYGEPHEVEDMTPHVEKTTFLECRDQDELEGQGKPLGRVHSDSSVSTLGDGSFRGAFSSAASKVTNSSRQPRWHHGCYMKYRLGACHVPNCAHLHDLDNKETASFMGWTQQENHVVFGSEGSDSSAHPGAGYRERRDLGDASEASSVENAVEAPLDSSYHDDGQPKNLGHQDLAEQLRRQVKGFSDDALAACLPRDSAGQLTTIGSILHESNTCKPCRHKMSLQPCAPQQQVNDSKSRTRPHKGKRERYRKYARMISDQIMADPFWWSATTMDLPQSIDYNPELKRKFMARMEAIAEYARTQVAQGAASSSALILPQSLGNIGMGVIAQETESTMAADRGGQHLPLATELPQPRKLLAS